MSGCIAGLLKGINRNIIRDRIIMSRKLIIILITAVLSLASTFPIGCANNAQTYGAYGAVGGGVIGAVAGGVGGAIVGAAIGGGVGYVIGNEEDKH